MLNAVTEKVQTLAVYQIRVTKYGGGALLNGTLIGLRRTIRSYVFSYFVLQRPYRSLSAEGCPQRIEYD